MQVVKAVGSAHILPGSPESMMLDNVLSTETSCVGSYMGLFATKRDFGVSDKVRLKPACLATETS